MLYCKKCKKIYNGQSNKVSIICPICHSMLQDDTVQAKSSSRENSQPSKTKPIASRANNIRKTRFDKIVGNLFLVGIIVFCIWYFWYRGGYGTERKAIDFVRNHQITVNLGSGGQQTYSIEQLMTLYDPSTGTLLSGGFMQAQKMADTGYLP